MNLFYRKIVYYCFAIAFGIFMWVYGGYDDSPGAQLIGLVLFIVGIVGLVKNKRIV